jgi:hypothetical protein
VRCTGALQQRIDRQLLRNHHRVGGDIEHPFRALDDRQQQIRIRKPHLEGQGRRSRHRRDRDRPRLAIDGDGAAIPGSVHGLDARRGARRQERDERLPVVRRAVAEAKPVTVRLRDRPLRPPPLARCGASSGEAGEPAQLRRCSCVGASHLAVEPAQAAKAGRDRHLREWQLRLVEQLLCRLHAARQRDVDGRGAEVLHEEPAQVPRGHAQAIRESIDALAVERAITNQPQRAGHDARGAEPCRRAGRRLGTATQAGPEAGGFSGGSGRVVADVLILGRSRRAYRTAVNFCGDDGDEKPAVEPRVTRLPRPVARRPIQFHHRWSLARFDEAGWSETDLVG